MKRILSLIIAVVMAFGCFAVVGSGLLYQGNSGYVNLKSSYDATKYTNPYVCTKKVRKDESGNTYATTYTYDSNGNITKEAYKGDVYYDYKCSYDSKGNPIKEFSGNSRSGYFTAISSYDSNNRLIKEIANSDEGYSNTYKYLYNSNGNISKIYYNGLLYWKYTYNSNGQISKKADSSGDDFTFYQYNSNGTLEIQQYDYSSYDQYTYDKYGRLTKDCYESYYSSNTKTYTYDSNNNLSKEVNKSNGSSYTYSYTWKKISTKSPVIDSIIHMQYATTAYTGNAKKPNIAIYGLRQGVDYKVTYSNNVNVGTAKAKITFLGENATQHPVTITFKITGSSSSSATYYKTTASLNLRKGPSTSYSTILTMPSGAKVKYLGSKSNGFYKVSYTKNSKTYTGWASASYLKKA